MQTNLTRPGRRLTGLVLGLLIGLVYGAVANNINVVIVREVPVHFTLSHSLANTISAAFVLGVMGYIVTWPEHGVVGVALTSILGAAVLAISSFSSLDGEAGSIVSALFVQMYLFLPFVVLFVPLNLLLRWAAGKFYNNPHEPLLSRTKSRALLIVLALAIAVGSFSLYDKEARTMMQKMTGYVQSAQGNDADAKIPAEFRPILRVVRSATSRFTVDWSDDLRKFPMPLEFEDAFAVSTMEIVNVYFESGEEVACLFRVSDRSLYLCAARP